MFDIEQDYIQVLMKRMTRRTSTYLFKSKTLLKEAPAQKVIDKSAFSDNDTLVMMWVLVLVILVIDVALQRFYNSATTSLTCSTYF